MEYKDIVLPNYDKCILGIITSILKYYNVETKHKSSEKIDKILNKKDYKNVILLILDGFGEHILNDISKNGFFKQNQIDIVTSVYPSTTTAALNAYYSGRTPYETGWIAWSQYFKEYGRALDMFSHKESYTGETLKNTKIDVFETIVKYKSIFEKIEESSPNVKTYEVEPEYAERRAKRSIIADNIDEIIMNVKDLCKIPDKKFILAYSDNPDSTLHKYGTKSDEAKDFIINTEEKLKQMCSEFDEDTILIISADHGHKDIENIYSILDYPEILECLIMPTCLESRCLTFYVKEDMKDTFVKRFNNLFEREFWLMSKKEFLDKYHFLGYGEKHPKIDDFIGDYVALSVSGSIIRLETFLAEGKVVKKSTHCGLSKEEMEVPVIICKK